jgi:hypothetical protein
VISKETHSPGEYPAEQLSHAWVAQLNPGVTHIEPRWPVVLAVIAVLSLLIALPDRLRVLPSWVPFLLAIVLIVPMVALSLTRAKARWKWIERIVTLLFLAIGSLALIKAEGISLAPVAPAAAQASDHSQQGGIVDVKSSKRIVVDGRKYSRTAAGVNTAVANCISGIPCLIEVPYSGDYSDAVIALGKSHVLILGVGVFIVSGIVGPDSNTDARATWAVYGHGVNQTTVRLADSKNVDVITSSNFSSFTRSASFWGVFHVTIADLTIDGNKVNQMQGFGIRLYGRGVRIYNVHIQDAKNDGLWTEWGGKQDHSLPTGDNQWFVTNITTYGNGGNGFTNKVSSDLNALGVSSYQNGAWGIETSYSMHMSQSDAYLNGSGGCHVNGFDGVAAALFGADDECTSASGYGLLIDNPAGASNINGTFGCDGCIGVQIGSQANLITGQFVNSAPAIKFNGARSVGNMAIGTVYNNTGLITWNKGGGDSLIKLTGTGTGTIFTDTTPDNAEISIDVPGVIGNPYFQARARTINVEGRIFQLPRSNGEIAALDLPQTWSAPQNFGGLSIGRGTILTKYARYIATLSPARVGAKTCTAQNFTVNGIEPLDVLIGVSKPTDQAGLSITPGHVAGANTVTVNFCNNTGLPIMPRESEIYSFVVVQ